jgi:hypothetical protein
MPLRTKIEDLDHTDEDANSDVNTQLISWSKCIHIIVRSVCG